MNEAMAFTVAFIARHVSKQPLLQYESPPASIDAGANSAGCVGSAGLGV